MLLLRSWSNEVLCRHRKHICLSTNQLLPNINHNKMCFRVCRNWSHTQPFINFSMVQSIFVRDSINFKNKLFNLICPVAITWNATPLICSKYRPETTTDSLEHSSYQQVGTLYTLILCPSLNVGKYTEVYHKWKLFKSQKTLKLCIM
jgi:hypothetical protein